MLPLLPLLAVSVMPPCYSSNTPSMSPLVFVFCHCCNNSPKTVTSHNTTLLFYSSVGLKSDTGLTEWKSRCWPGCIPFWGLQERIRLFAPSDCRGHPHSFLAAPSLLLQSQQWWVESSHWITPSFSASLLHFKQPLREDWAHPISQNELPFLRVTD